jgi:hypothetical protein
MKGVEERMRLTSDSGRGFEMGVWRSEGRSISVAISERGYLQRV